MNNTAFREVTIKSIKTYQWLQVKYNCLTLRFYVTLFFNKGLILGFINSGNAFTKMTRFWHSRLCLRVTIDTLQSAVNKSSILIIVYQGLINICIAQYSSRCSLRPQSALSTYNRHCTLLLWRTQAVCLLMYVTALLTVFFALNCSRCLLRPQFALS